ncbi:hypothetical protein LXL04_038658 [Taraxacum kok-saghyz]
MRRPISTEAQTTAKKAPIQAKKCNLSIFHSSKTASKSMRPTTAFMMMDARIAFGVYLNNGVMTKRVNITIHDMTILDTAVLHPDIYTKRDDENLRFGRCHGLHVSTIAPLISVMISIVCVFLTRADRDGVQIVRHIDKGINPSSANQIYFSGDYLAKGFNIGVISGLIALTIDGNKEVVALGTMNIVGSLTSCYVAIGSFSRSAVNYMSGCNTAVSNIVMSCIVMLTLLVITPLFKYTPNAILASIIINAVVGLIDFDAFLACMGAFFGVVCASVEIGLLIVVAILFAKILLQVTRPRTAVLGKIPRTSVYRNVEQYPGATRVPDVLIIRVDSAIYFSNSNYIMERILRWLTD